MERCAGLARTGLTASLAATIFICTGCVAYQFSSAYLPAPGEERNSEVFQNLVLGVESTDPSQSYQLEKFMAALKKTGLFKEVLYKDRLSRADLILTSFSETETDPYEACPLGFAGQILMVGTGGLVPQTCKAEHRLSFVLYAPHQSQHKKSFSIEYETRSIVGWAALFLMPSADWTSQPSEERYPNLLQAAFSREAPAIEGLLR
ncbi:MAG TPA: hypothetical protein VE131_00395 [Terriglobales bacterium]|nr:hypothetical protein [Terriglobales bacterium]